MHDDPGLAAFCDDLHPRLVAMLELYVNDISVAEELAQESLIRVCQHWPRVRVMSNPEGWAVTVTFNLARSWWRRQYAEQRARRRHGPSPDREDATDVAASVALREAVSGLPARQRQAIILRFFADLPVADTAEVMGCARGTVRSLTAKAMVALRDEELAWGTPRGRHAPPCPATDVRQELS